MLLYKITAILLFPVFIIVSGRKIWGYHGSGKRLAELVGYYSRPRPEGGVIWIHAASVGEVMVAVSLIDGLRESFPSLRILVTTNTSTGADRVYKICKGQVDHVYLPYDLPGPVSRFLNFFRPVTGVILEREIWPNLFHQCGRQQIPLLLANVRLSQRSFEGYRRWVSPLVKGALQQVSWAGVQGEADCKRLIDLGIDPGKANVTGSIKFDLTLPESLGEQGKSLRNELGAQRPTWIAASTREGEEQYVLKAHQQILQQIPDALLILVPRHPERFNSVARQVESAGFQLVRRSDPRPGPPPLRGREAVAEVYLGDTMGEMLLLYAASDVAYVGGSLVPTGSHNMLEPAALGKPVLFGPHRFNFAEISQMLIDQGAAQEVLDADQLAAAVIDLLQNPEKQQQQGRQGQRVVEQNRGALDRLLIGVRKYLSPVSSPCKGED